MKLTYMYNLRNLITLSSFSSKTYNMIVFYLDMWKYILNLCPVLILTV